MQIGLFVTAAQATLNRVSADRFAWISVPVTWRKGPFFVNGTGYLPLYQTTKEYVSLQLGWARRSGLIGELTVGVHNPVTASSWTKDLFDGKFSVAYLFVSKRLKVELSFQQMGWPELRVCAYRKSHSSHSKSEVHLIPRTTYALLRHPGEQKFLETLLQKCTDQSSAVSEPRAFYRAARKGFLQCNQLYDQIIAEHHAIAKDFESIEPATPSEPYSANGMQLIQTCWQQFPKKSADFQNWLEKCYRVNHFKIWANWRLTKQYDQLEKQYPASQDMLKRMQLCAQAWLDQQTMVQQRSWGEAKYYLQTVFLNEPTLYLELKKSLTPFEQTIHLRETGQRLSTVLSCEQPKAVLVPINCLLYRVQLWKIFEKSLNDLEPSQPELYECLLQMIHQPYVDYERALNHSKFPGLPAKKAADTCFSSFHSEEVSYQRTITNAFLAALEPIKRHLEQPKPPVFPTKCENTLKIEAAQNFLITFQKHVESLVIIDRMQVTYLRSP